MSVNAPGKSENTTSAANANSKPPQIGSVPIAAKRMPKPLNSRLAGGLVFCGGLGGFITGQTFSLRKKIMPFGGRRFGSRFSNVGSIPESTTSSGQRRIHRRFQRKFLTCLGHVLTLTNFGSDFRTN